MKEKMKMCGKIVRLTVPCLLAVFFVVITALYFYYDDVVRITEKGEGTYFTAEADEERSYSLKGRTIVQSYTTTREEIETITKYAFKVNEVLKEYFMQANIELIDFKIEFGRYHGQIILADETSPDTCRLWDATTHEKLDKDRFRRDMGNVEEAYNEVFKRLGL